jgi:hypothetical protein
MARFAYIDGNNNTYEIGERLEYIPITKAQSSSGMYSGGDPKSVPLDAEQRAALIALLDQIVGDTPNVIADRPKGCGTVIRGDDRVCCRGDSPLKAELERTLKTLLA